jgi:hypothetical protein
MHNALMTEKKQAALLSLASTSVGLSTLPLRRLLFGFDAITVNPRLITSNDIFQKNFVVICPLEEIFRGGKSLQFPIISQAYWHKLCQDPMHS